MVYDTDALYLLEDMDECSASIPACDVNATCQNTIGSYICTCKTGLTGDGKSTCSGETIVENNYFLISLIAFSTVNNIT